MPIPSRGGILNSDSDQGEIDNPQGIDTLTASVGRNLPRPRSGRKAALLPDRERPGAKLLEDAARQKMTLDVEGVVDGGVDRQEPLGGSRRLEPLLFSFALSNRLVRVFSAIVCPQSLIMDRGKPLFTDGDGIGFELVRGDPLRRKALLLLQLSQQFLGRSSAASWLDQEVKHLALVVDRPPQSMFPATDLDDHLVQMPTGTRPWTTVAKIAGDQPAKLQKPAPNRLV